MQITNLTLAYLLLEIGPLLQGAHISKIQEIDKNLFKFKLHTKHGTKDLLFCSIAPYITQYKIPAKPTPKGFAEFVRKQLANKKIISVKQHNLDRVVVVEFDSHYLIFEHFSDSNIILTNKDMKILMPLKKQEWRDRKIKRSETYKFPQPKGTAPNKITLRGLEHGFSASKKEVIGTLISSLNIAPQFAEEACFLAEVDKKAAANTMPQKEIKQLVQEIKKIYAAPTKKRLKPVLADNKILLPWQLSVLPREPQKRVGSINSAIDEAISVDFLRSESKQADAKKTKQQEKITISLETQKRAEERFSQQQELNKKKAELIYANYAELSELVSSLNKALSKGVSKKDVMYKLNSATKQGNKSAKLFKKIDAKKRKAMVELTG